MSQYETEISILSERLAGRPLKRIQWKDTEREGIEYTLVSFVFEGNNDTEWYVQVYGREISPSAGKKQLPS